MKIQQRKSVMKIQGSYDSVGDVPQEFKDSFTEVDGKFVLTGSIETKDTADYKEVLKLKQSSFDDMHKLKEQLKAETQAKTEIQSKLEVVELQIKDGADPAKLQELVETKVKVQTEELTKQLAEANEKNGEFQNKIYGNEKADFVNGIVGSFSDTVKDDAKFMLNQIFERQADNTYLTKEGLGLEAGLNAEQATAKLLETRTHWQKQNTSDGASGGGEGGATGKNPFAKDSFNRTEQHKMMLDNPALAKTMQAQAEKE
jgi:hypothetical protein